MWGKYGVEKIVVTESGVFVVRFRLVEEKDKAMEERTIMYDKKPVIMKHWELDLDLRKEDAKVVPTWIRLPNLALKYSGQQTLHKLVSKVGTPIRSDKATSQKDMLAYARVLIEVKMDQEFTKEIVFVNEKGSVIVQLMQ